MKVECLQEEMRSLGRKTTLPSICFTLILQHLVWKINNDNKLTISLILYKIIFYMECYKSSTTWKKMNWTGHELLSFQEYYRKSPTRAAIGKLILKIAFKVSRNWIENRQLILAEYVQRAFRSKLGTSKAFSAALSKSLLITHSLIQALSTLMRGEFDSIRKEKQKAHFFFLN